MGLVRIMIYFNSIAVPFDFVMDARILVRLSPSLFSFLDSVVLYAGRTQSLGRLQPSLVCQVVMPWSRLGGEKPKVR